MAACSEYQAAEKSQETAGSGHRIRAVRHFLFDLRKCVAIAPQISADKNVMNRPEVQERVP